MAKNQELNRIPIGAPGGTASRAPTTTVTGATSSSGFTVQPRPIGDTYTSRVFALREVRDYTQRLVGSLLDLLDASITDQRQRAALRKLIMRECWEAHYRPAMEWVDREVTIETRDGIPVQSWYDVDNYRAMHPTGLDSYNVFPFSVTPIAAAADQSNPPASV